MSKKDNFLIKPRKTMRVFLFFFVLLFSQVNLAQYAFRGAWIATVANIDWPQADSYDDPDRQKKDLALLIDSLHALGINNILFQIRPTADALYRSKLEPTSHWLLGKQGAKLHFDPLDLIIRLAHKKNIKVHAWINPYRVNLSIYNPEEMYVPAHVFNRNRHWFWQYGTQWLFNPALKQTRYWLCDVIDDIICRYNVDGIHLDDYFYPYPQPDTPLPDEDDFKKYNRGFKNIADWRRDNVNKTIEAVYRTVKSHNRKVEFGISPFGVWRNKSQDPRGSETNAGMNNYDDLYADILLWIKKGWVDYIIPQLYWEIGKKNADYKTLAQWWANQTCKTHTKLYIGMAVYRLNDPNDLKVWREDNQIAKQMRLNRTIKNIKGECFYSASVLLQNPQGVCDSIKKMYAIPKPKPVSKPVKKQTSNTTRPTIPAEKTKK